MTSDEFQKISRELLVDAWGEKSFPHGQLQKLWFIVRDISAGDFRFALDNLSLNCNRAPSLGQVRAACFPSINKAREDKKRKRLTELSEQASCSLCGNSGWVEAYKALTPHVTYAFICSCEAALVLGFSTTRGAKYWRDASHDETWNLRRFDSQSDKAYQISVTDAVNALAAKYSVPRQPRIENDPA